MKTIIAFFVAIGLWFVKLYRKFNPYWKEKKPAPVTRTYLPSIAEPVKYAQRMVPQHNNRKNTRGRLIQYINVGEGRQRVIYHSAR